EDRAHLGAKGDGRFLKRDRSQEYLKTTSTRSSGLRGAELSARSTAHASTSPQTRWTRSVCASWIRAVFVEATESVRSAASAAAFPSRPVNATAVAPRTRAAASPRTTFSLRPDVVIPMTTSPGRA